MNIETKFDIDEEVQRQLPFSKRKVRTKIYAISVTIGKDKFPIIRYACSDLSTMVLEGELEKLE